MATEFPEGDQHEGSEAPGEPDPLGSDQGAVPLLPPGDMRPLPGQLETAPDGSIRPASIGSSGEEVGSPESAGGWSPGTAPRDFAPPAPGLIDEALTPAAPEDPGHALAAEAPSTHYETAPMSKPPLPDSGPARDALGATPSAEAPAWAGSGEGPAASMGGANEGERSAWPTVEPDAAGGVPQAPSTDQSPAVDTQPGYTPETQYPAAPQQPAPHEQAPAPAEYVPEAPSTIVRPPEEAATGEEMYDVPLGTLVYRSGLLSADQIESALAESERIGKRLGEVLIDNKMIDERDLGRLLAGQKGLPFLDLGQMQLDAEATELLPAASARIYCALPIAVEKGTPVVAVSDPTNGLVVEGVRRAMGGELSFAVATRSDLQRAIAHNYGEDVEQEAGIPAEEPSPESSFATSADSPAAVVVDDAAPSDVAAHDAPAYATDAPAAEAAPASAEAAPASAEDALHESHGTALESGVVANQPSAPLIDAGQSDPPVVAEHEPTPLHTPIAIPDQSLGTPPSEKTVRVMIRLTDGDQIDAGGYATNDQAIERARALIDSIEGRSGSDWPFLNGRFLRPETIVSIDLVEERPRY